MARKWWKDGNKKMDSDAALYYLMYRQYSL